MIELISLNKSHLDQTFVWMQSQSLKRMFFLKKEITRQHHLEWFERYEADKTQMIFAIYYTGDHVGNIGLKNISQHRTAETWIYIGAEDIRGKGVAQKSYEALLKNPSFHELNIRKLYCHIADFNIVSIALYTRLGFSLEGVLREEVEIEDQYHSLIRMGKIL